MVDGEPRLFIAVALPAEAREACERVIAEARAGSPTRGIRWVRTDNLHITLRFLGPTPEKRISAVEAAVRDTARKAQPFEVALAEAGAFPEARRIRTLWIGIERGAPELTAVSRALGEPLAPLGWPQEDRPFRPHLTVARTDAAPGRDGARAAAALEAAAADWRVDFRASAVTLFRSHLAGGPPTYEPLVEAPLGG